MKETKRRVTTVAINPMAFMQIKGMLDTFKRNHPKVPMFFQAAAQSTGVGSIIEISVTSPDGKKINTNMRVTEDDVQLIQQLKQMGMQ